MADDAADGLSPSVRRMVAEHDIDVAKLTGTRQGGRVTKEDVEAFIKNLGKGSGGCADCADSMWLLHRSAPLAGRTEKRVPMTRLRKRIAERLLEAKNTTAMLTTFNGSTWRPSLAQAVRRIFEAASSSAGMSFYVKAVVESLKRYPGTNGAGR